MEEDIFECTDTDQEDNLTGTAIGDVVMLAPHDFLAPNEEKQSRDKYGWTYFVRGDDYSESLY